MEHKGHERDEKQDSMDKKMGINDNNNPKNDPNST